MERLRAAVVGVGMIGRLHARIYHEHPLAELVGVVDVDAERAEEIGREFGVSWYRSVEDLLFEADADVVSVATPEQARYQPAVACAQAGKHLLLEKPLAPNLEEADRLVAAIQETGVLTMVNFILRFDPRYLRAREAIADGSVGELCTVFARRRGTSVGAEVYGPWTDLLISTGIHDLDVMAWLADSPVRRIYAEGISKRSAQWGHDDAVMVLVRFENGVIGSLETSWVLPPSAPSPLDASLEVVGTRGGVFIEGSSHGLALLDEAHYVMPDLAHWPVGQMGVGGDLWSALDHFIGAVLEDRPPVVGLAEARRAQEMVAAAKASMVEQRPISFPYREGG